MEKYDIVKEIKRHKIPYHSMNNIRHGVAVGGGICGFTDVFALLMCSGLRWVLVCRAFSVNPRRN
jgi:hypothetical protein